MRAGADAPRRVVSAPSRITGGASRVTGAVGTPSDAEDGDWWFLGTRVSQLTPRSAQMVVAEAVLPEGASPPLHVHDDLDDSFYVVEGEMVVRCSDDVSLATPGTWVPFPRRLPHTFRVMGGPARVLMVHANDSFLRAVRSIGRPAADEDVPTIRSGPRPDELARAMAANDITAVGAPMEEDEAQSWLQALRPGPT
ncbi:MAG TPA: cupin domain-containing protein [Acidimicrobiales bacterium]|nr:cupin domain-containing protein [Acidimicrobiales bacterium]